MDSDLSNKPTNCGNLCEHNTAKGICETARVRVGWLASGRRKSKSGSKGKRNTEKKKEETYARSQLESTICACLLSASLMVI